MQSRSLYPDASKTKKKLFISKTKRQKRKGQERSILSKTKMSNKSLWQSFCDTINGPMITRLYVTFLLASFSFVVLTWRDFGRHYDDRLEDLMIARAMNATICYDPEKIVMTRKEDDCRIYMRTLYQWPVVWAFYDVLEDLSICGRGGCFQLLDGYASSYIVKFTIAIVLFYLFFMLATGVGTWQNHKRAALSKYDLPSDGMQVVPFKQYDQDSIKDDRDEFSKKRV